MATLNADEVSKMKRASEAEYWRRAQSRFIDFLKSKNVKQKEIGQILQDISTVEDTRSSIEGSKRVGDTAYGKTASLVVQKMHILISMGDFAFKGGPEILGFVWTGFKFIFGGIKADYDACHMLADACAVVISMFIECRVYGGIFFAGMAGSKDPTGSLSKVQDCIEDAYLGILKFSYTAKRYFSKNDVLRVLKAVVLNAAAEFKPNVDEITRIESALVKWAKLALENRNVETQDKLLETDRQLLVMARSQSEESAASQKRFQSALSQISEKLDDVGEIIKSKLTSKTPLQIAEEECVKNLTMLQQMFPPAEEAWDSTSKAHPDTCKWLFELQEYQTWVAEPRNILWLYGGIGVGKSVLMKAALDDLTRRFDTDDRCVVQYLSCSFGDNDVKKACKIMSKMIAGVYENIRSTKEVEDLRTANEIFKRCTSQKEGVKESAKEIGKAAKVLSGEPSSQFTLGQLYETYEGLTIVGEFRIFLLIDGLEQCDEAGQAGIAAKLSLLAENKNTSVNVLVSSRPQPGDFDTVLEKRKIPTIIVKDHTADDMNTVIRHGLNQFSGWTPYERNIACEEVVKAAKGLFRYIPQALAFLEQPFERPLENKLKQLRSLPNGLQGLYQEEFRRVDPAYVKLLQTALTWATLSRGDIIVDEVMDAFSGTFTKEFKGTVDDVPTRIAPTQLKKAGGSFLRFQKVDEVQDVTEDVQVTEGTLVQYHYFVQIRDEEIATCFVREPPSELQTRENSGERSCETEKKLDEPREWFIDPLEGHMSIAKTCLLHLISPLFQEKFLFALLQPTYDKAEESNEENRKDEKPEQATDSSDNREENLNPAENSPLNKLPIVTVSLIQEIIEPERPLPSENTQKTDNGEPANEHESETGFIKSESIDVDNTIANAGGVKLEVPGVDNDLSEIASNNSEEDYEYAKWSLVPEMLSNDTTTIRQAGGRLRYEISSWAFHVQKVEKLSSSGSHERMDKLWDLVETFFAEEAAVNAWWNSLGRSPPKTTSLHKACHLGLTGLVKRLLERGEKPNDLDGLGRTALTYVPPDVSPELVKLLLQYGADPYFVDETPGRDNIPPIHAVMLADPQTEVIRLLLESNAMVAKTFTPNRHGYSGLHCIAACSSGIDKLELLMNYEGADINVTDRFGDTPLHYLLDRPETNIELLKAFLNKGADATRDNQFSEQPLCFVCQRGNIEALNCLADSKVDIYDDDIDQQTALHHATRGGHLNVIKRLYELADDKKKLLNKEDKCGRTPFYWGCSHENPEISEFLLRSMIENNIENINKLAKSGKTPLRKAAFQGHANVVKMLLDLPDVRLNINDRTDVSGQTPLHAAAYRGHLDTIKLLLEAGSDTTLQDKSQRTPLQKCYQSWGSHASDALEQALVLLIDHDPEAAAHDQELFSLAAMRGSSSIVKKLLDFNADPTGVDEMGWTPLQVAQQFGKDEVIEMLKEMVAERGNKPKQWNLPPGKSSSKISDDGLMVEHVSIDDDTKYLMILADCPIPLGLDRYYYETSISGPSKKSKLEIAIGLSTKPLRALSRRLPGWYWVEPSGLTWAFHGDDSKLYGSPDVFGPSYANMSGFGDGHTIGCGWNIKEGTIFYTKNGVHLGIAFHGVKGRLFPNVGTTENVLLETNFGTDIVEKPFAWKPANDRSSKW